MNLEKLENTSGSLDNEAALKIIESGQGRDVAENLGKFENLSNETALKLIESGQVKSVANYLEKFEGLDHNEIALKIIESGNGDSVASNLYQFKSLNGEIAFKLIELGQGDSVAIHLGKFEGLDHNEIAFKLIESGKASSIFNNLPNFKNLNNETALKFIESRCGGSVSSYLEKFEGLDHNEIAFKIIESGQSSSVINNLEKFEGLDYNETALKIIESGEGIHVIKNLGKFKGLHGNEIVFGLISEGLEQDELDTASFNLSTKEREDVDKYIENCSANYLRPDEGYLIKDDLIDGKKINDGDYEMLVDKMKDSNPKWKDIDNIYGPFKNGAEQFGYRKMFRFLDRDNITRHDQLYNFDKVIQLYESSELKPNEFFNNILDQVKKDKKEYEDIGTSYHKLNILSNTVSNLDFEEIFKKFKEFGDVIDSSGINKDNVFDSWKSLNKFYDISKELERGDLLDNLRDLKKENKEELYNYVKKLMFHPNIDTSKVMMFWKEPAKFLDVEEIHANESHQLKKPSNYTNIPHLDLTSENLRDALVEGHLDKIQDFQPLEIEYSLTKKTELDKLNLTELMFKALGKRSEGIKGEAQNPNQLFKSFNNLFKRKGLKLFDFLKLTEQEDIDEYFKDNLELKKAIEEEVFDEKIGLEREKQESQEFRAKINKKSDPDGVIAGNDTVNCMPFGSGKNTVYTFNPGCLLFTLQRKDQDGKWKTVTESVLTKDKDIKRKVSEVLSEMEKGNTKLVDLLDRDVLKEQPSIITCDNIEVTPTFSSSENDKIIETIYRDFFNEYVNRYQKEENLNNSKVVIGIGYNDSLNNLPLEDNTFVPEAPLGYSDNIGDKALILDLKNDNPYTILKKDVKETKIERNKENIKLPRGVQELTYKDTLSVSYIEGKAYHDNESLMEYMHNLENGLIAKDINNACKNRDNLSLKYIGDDKEIHGYLIAYEGVAENEPMIYIQDLASDGNARAGGSLIKGFLEKYKVNYLDKDNPIPILAQFREQTSLKILNRQLDNFSKQLGKKLVLEEIGEHTVGDDTMHEIVIRVEENS